MENLIKPKVTIIDYGPKLKLSNGEEITPDEFVWAASGITYKDIETVKELLDIKSGKIKVDEEKFRGKSLKEKIELSLIASAGSGHASMATTPGFWVFLEGNCSKLVDSIFTGARFSSSLMPSGRRVPIETGQVVITWGIIDKGFKNFYMGISKNNIALYEQLQKRGISTQEASKIVQYGHRGGGFGFIPLETLICVSRNLKEKNNFIPDEGKEIVKQIEDFIYRNGMCVTYEARSNAPRTGCPNPNIFHNRKNFVQELIEENFGNVLYTPALISASAMPSEDRDRRISDYLKRREKLFATKEGVESNWREMLRELELIVEDHNDSVSAKTVSNTSLRVRGEVKRHRTLGQTTESFYNGVKRAINVINNDPFGSLAEFESVVSIPPQIGKDPELSKLWITAFSNSIKCYERMVYGGVKESDAILVVPRGLKLGVVKTFDFYNLTTGYMSLRSCGAVEPEMMEITEKEISLIRDNLPDSIGQLMTPKCFYVGSCSDRYCGKVNQVSPFYNKGAHEEMKKARESLIRDKINMRRDSL